mmetsp:Transcript_107588/g.310898  ORF Transcript_107588/g.310898 Transcript_107588/m.310898 type:complete len:223 (+) Transcript_107588:710-1378(+)
MPVRNGGPAQKVGLSRDTSADGARHRRPGRRGVGDARLAFRGRLASANVRAAVAGIPLRHLGDEDVGAKVAAEGVEGKTRHQRRRSQGRRLDNRRWRRRRRIRKLHEAPAIVRAVREHPASPVREAEETLQRRRSAGYRRLRLLHGLELLLRVKAQAHAGSVDPGGATDADGQPEPVHDAVHSRCAGRPHVRCNGGGGRPRRRRGSLNCMCIGQRLRGGYRA